MEIFKNHLRKSLKYLEPEQIQFIIVKDKETLQKLTFEKLEALLKKKKKKKFAERDNL